MQKKILDADGGTGIGYEPVIIPKDKYAKIVQGRNVFFATCIGGAAVVWTLSMVPQGLMYRSLRKMYQTYCIGRVLDLTPKIADTKDVAFYEMSKAVRVEFIIEHKGVDDGRYKINDLLSEADQERRRKDMTLDFMVKNDHNWVGSTITFDTIERSKIEIPDFQKYDTVVIRNELLNKDQKGARHMLNSAAMYVKKDGHILLMDFGKPSWPILTSFIRWFNSLTASSMHLTHDYNSWIKEDARYFIVEERRCLMGLHYAFALRLR
ncbi:hypothetical protein LSM04_009173 [Trypanosoma melophagium]|uniref:uncharacterized protein n=1 Tax=Trypanosoma melophagium TaxID=715481 RepID=UPI00351A8FB5|nr:hypothetical protein LSM04_009173 [Trypanosoma melophagium]